MTRIGTTTPGITPASLTQGAPVSAVLSQLPSTLAEVAIGTFLTGTVLERNANGMTLLQTPNGLLGLKTTVPLPPGSSVTLQIQTAGAQVQAIVLSVTPQAQGGSPAPAPGAPLAHPTAHQPVAAATGTPAPVAASAAAPHPSTITATVIGPSGGPVPAAVAQPLPGATAATAQTAATPSPPSTQAAPQAAPGAPAPTATSALAATTPQTVLANTQQSTATDPAAAQAAYQRQLNAVPTTASATATPHAPAQSAVSPVPVPAGFAPPPPPAADASLAKPIFMEAVPLPTGTQVQVRLLPSLQAGQPALPLPAPDAYAETGAATVRQSAANPAQPNPVIAATVVARTPAGQVILDSALGRLLAPLPRDGEATAPGARLLLELIMGERPAAARPAASGLAALARNWSTLKDAMRQLSDAPGQQDTAAAIDRAVPKPGPRLAQQMLSYLENAQSGVKAWLGEPVARVLAQFGGQRMLEQLDRDLREMQLSRHGAEGEWRMSLVPLLENGQLRQIRFFERRRKQEEEKRRKEEPARFVVECETSAHGVVQLDGLMHEKRIDLIVRTHAPLPPDMEHEIVVLFAETCTGLDLAGQVFFQAVPAFPISPLDEIAAAPVRVEV
jgi:hypothetical protein